MKVKVEIDINPAEIGIIRYLKENKVIVLKEGTEYCSDEEYNKKVCLSLFYKKIVELDLDAYHTTFMLSIVGQQVASQV